jgi:glycyl-tRNA synthetase
VAPNKVLIAPLSSDAGLTPIAHRISARLRKLGVPNVMDSSSASIGKRYARNDELGTPLAVTVDFYTLKDGSVTLRERDTTNQVRGSEERLSRRSRGWWTGLIRGIGFGGGWGGVLSRAMSRGR